MIEIVIFIFLILIYVLIKEKNINRDKIPFHKDRLK